MAKPLPISLEIFQVGSPCLVYGDIPATITGVIIREHLYIQYEVSYADGKTICVKWVEQCLISRDKDSASIEIGFV